MAEGKEGKALPLLLISKAELDIAEKFLHQLIDSVCKQRGPQFKDFSSTWNIKEWIDLNDSWTAKLRSWIGNDISKEEIKSEMSEVGISEDLIIKILICITLRKNDVKKALVQQTASIASSYLKNFDWKVKMVMSSDKLANIREPLTDVNFELQTEDGSVPVSLELDKDELKSVIDKLEAANKAVLQLRS